MERGFSHLEFLTSETFQVRKTVSWLSKQRHNVCVCVWFEKNKGGGGGEGRPHVWAVLIGLNLGQGQGGGELEDETEKKGERMMGSQRGARWLWEQSIMLKYVKYRRKPTPPPPHKEWVYPIPNS